MFGGKRNTVSKAISTSWRFLSERFLLEWPVVSIFITTGVCLALASRLTSINVVYSIRNTLGASNMDIRRQELDTEQLFPSRPRFSRLLFTTLEFDGDGEGADANILTKATFDEIWEVADKVARIEAGVEDARYEALCYRHSASGQCAPYGVLSFWGADEALYRISVGDSRSLRLELSSKTFRDGTPVPRDLIFGDYKLIKDEASNEEVMEFARGVVVTYALDEKRGNEDTILEWEQAFLRLAAEANLTSSKMMWQAAMSYDNEQKAGVSGWGYHATNFSLVVTAIASSFLLGDNLRMEMPPLHTRIALGSIGVAFLVLSTAAAGGVLELYGVPVSGLHSTVIVLVCVVAGLKNLFSLCAELDDGTYDVHARHRVHSAASHWAPGAVLDATVSIMVLVVWGGAFSSLATKSFCAYGAAGILLGLLSQVFGLIPSLLIIERRRDVGRLNRAWCFKSAHLDIIDGPPLFSRRDSFVLQPPSDSHHRPASATEEIVNTVEAWNDTGDEQMPSSPCYPASGNVSVTTTKSPPSTPSSGAYHSSEITLEVSRHSSHDPGGCREVWSAKEAGKELLGDRAAAMLGGIIGGNRHLLRLTQDGATENSNGRIGWFPHRIPKSHRSFSPLQSPGHFEVRNRGQTSRLQKAALVKAANGTHRVTGGSAFAKASVAGRDRGSAMGGSGSGGGCLGLTIMQGYCNWLLDGNNPRWVVLSGFGILLAVSFTVGLKHGSPGYNINDFCPRSSYLRDFVTTARRQGILFGENVLPVATYIQSAELFTPVMQQAILDLEPALVSSSPFTIDITSNVEGDAIVHGNTTSSWLRGFIAWLPSSSYASMVGGSGHEVELWVGTAELFHNAVKDFLAHPGYQRFEGDLSFDNGIATGCRIWVQHRDFRGPTAVSTMKAAKEAIRTLGMEPYSFVFATEYALAEHFESVVREILGCLMLAAVSTAVVGYMLLANLALVCILTSAVFAVQVEAFAMVAFLNAGINAHAIPSLFLAVALGTGSVGAMMMSFASQDCERSFNANLRISVVQTAGPIGSASAVIAISTLPLLLFSASSPSATYFIQAFASSTLWAVLLALLHGLLLTPTLMIVFQENLTTRPTSTHPLAAGAETLPPWLPRAAPGETAELIGNGYVIAVGTSGAVAVLDDENAKYINRSGGALRGHNRSIGSRHLDAQCPNGSQGIPDLLPETELALQAIGARTATQVAMMVPDTAGPVASKGEQASPRTRSGSWGEM